MDARMESKLSMYNAVLTHIEANPAITATVPAFATVATTLRTLYNNIVDAAQQEAQIIAGVSINKAETKINLCTEAASIAAAVYAWATSQSNYELKEQMNYSVSRLQQTKDELLVPVCNNIFSSANTNAAALAPYGITAARVTAFQTLIDEYVSVIPAPRNAASNRSAVRTTLINLFNEGDEIMKLQMDKLSVQFKNSNAAFYNAYKNNRVIINAASVQTQVKGVVVDILTNLPVPSVAVQVVGQAYNATSDSNGHYSVKIPVPGSYNLNFSKGSYNSKTENNINVSLGVATTHNTQLTPL